MSRAHPPPRVTGRRQFLSRISMAAGGAWLVQGRARASGPARPASPDDRPLPAISLGPHRITRLVAGWNPIGGH
ncbi:MAG: hypothetical protein JXA90_03680, partial [Planctomycetes bacterium]|nr:hypothetical protein [Planctomycetota bacterium]